MNEPIKCGDDCEVVSGVFGEKGLNLGKQVRVESLQGEHSEYGRIWRCSGDNLVTHWGEKSSYADFAVAWLRKIPPLNVNNEIEKSITVD